MALNVIYYPSINIGSEEWLKSSLLYWDTIETIVPFKRRARLEKDTLEIQSAYQAGVVTALNVDDMDKIRAYENLKFILRREHRIKDLEDLVKVKPNVASRFKAEGDAYWIYPEKIDPELLQRLKELGWLKNPKPFPFWGDDRHVASPEFYYIYMTALSEAMAERRNCKTITDDERDLHLWTALITASRTPDEYKTSHSLIRRLDIPFPSPHALRHKTMVEVLIHREKYKDERFAFQNAISAIWDALSEKSDNEAEDFLSSKRKEIGEATKNFRASLRGFGVDMTSGVLAVAEILESVLSATLRLPTLFGVLGIPFALKELREISTRHSQRFYLRGAMSYAIKTQREFDMDT